MTKAQNETASRASCKEQLHPGWVMVKHGKEAVNGTALRCLDLVDMYGEKNKRTLMESEVKQVTAGSGISL